jgi:serine phosphatase RsbU (regulator of sigma subunit)
MDDFKTSIELLFKSLEESSNEEGDDLAFKSQVYVALGRSYRKVEAYETSKDYYKKSIEITKNSEDDEMLIYALNGISETYILTEEWDKAYRNLNEARQLLSSEGKSLFPQNSALLARIKIEFEEYDSAQYYLEIGEKEVQKWNDNGKDLIKIYKYYSLLNLKIKNYDLAILYANKMMDIGFNLKKMSDKYEASRLLYEIHEKKKDYVNSFFYLKKHLDYKDSLAIDEAKNVLFKVEMDMVSAQQSLEDSLRFNTYNILKNTQIENHKKEILQVQKTKTLLYVTLGLVLVALIGFIFSLLGKRRDNEIITKQNIESERQKEQLADQNAKLESKATLYKILQVCSSDLDLNEILKIVLTELLKVKLIGSKDKGCILRVDGDGQIVLSAERSLREEDKNGINKVTLDECLCGNIYRTSKIEFCESENFGNHFNVPIINKDSVQGIIILFTDRSTPKMGEVVEFLESIGILLGETIYRHRITYKLRMAHIENTIKKKEIQRANVKVNESLLMQETINDLMGTIIRNENVGEKVYNYINGIFKNDFIKRLNITLFDFEKGTGKFYFCRENGVDKLKNEEFELSTFSDETMNHLKKNERMIVESMLDRVSLSISDKQKIKNNINAFVSFPLMMDGNLLGALNLSFEDKIEISEEQEKFTQMLIEGITIAIHQNLLFSQISTKNYQLSELNSSIKASINYAQKLQNSVLPTFGGFDEVFSKNFAYLKQKDTVGGDFYWVREYDDGVKMIACVDCTGHGIPGAFMTMLSRVLLREAATIKGLRCPSEILMQMDKAVRRVLRQYNYTAMQDGMDMTICVVDQNRNNIAFSAAQRPIVLKFKGADQLAVIKGSRFPVGGYYEDLKKFKVESFDLNSVEKFYLFSDGYVDQFGGPNIKKYSTRQMIKTLQLICDLPMEKQMDFLINEISAWKGELDQIDDILVLGVQL